MTDPRPAPRAREELMELLESLVTSARREGGFGAVHRRKALDADHAALVQSLDALLERCEAAERDARRLDWIEAQMRSRGDHGDLREVEFCWDEDEAERAEGLYLYVGESGWGLSWVATGENIRAALDAAMGTREREAPGRVEAGTSAVARTPDGP